jgi:hypothetical protein
MILLLEQVEQGMVIPPMEYREHFHNEYSPSMWEYPALALADVNLARSCGIGKHQALKMIEIKLLGFGNV